MNKTIFRFCYLGLILVFLTVACKKKPEPVTPVEPNPIDTDLDFKLRVLNTKHQEINTLLRGENFILSFIIINKSSTYWRLQKESLTKNNDFLRVYRDNDKTNIGKPFFSFYGCILVPSIGIIPNDTLKLEIPWQYDSKLNVPYDYFCGVDSTLQKLPQGLYKTTLKETLNIFRNNDKTYSKDVSFEKQFEIQ